MSEEDKRPQNIILAQAERQKAADPMAATDVPQPTTSRQAPPQMPQAGDIYEMVRGMVMSALSNNVTINGQHPEAAGGNVNFNTGETKNASDKFVELNQPVTKAEERKNVIGATDASLVQRLHTPGLDSQIIGDPAAPSNAGKNIPPVTLRNLDVPTGIQRGGYAGKGQTARNRGPSKIKQAERNRTGRPFDIPVKTELPNKVVEHDTTNDGKTFARLLVSRGDGVVHSLMNVDLSSATEVSLGNLPPSNTYFKATGGSSHPFKLVTAEGGWKIESDGSSITNGTNGDSLGISGLSTTRATAGNVAIRVTIDSSLNASGATVVVGSFSQEVVMSGTPPEQNQAWYLIGKVISSGSPATYSFIQATTSAALLTHGLLNGVAVRVFEAHPSHPDSL